MNSPSDGSGVDGASGVGDMRPKCANVKGFLNFLRDVRASRAGGDINALPQTRGKWERLECVVDSGATVSVMSAECARDYAVQPSAASRAGITYQVANGDEIANLGEKVVPVVTDEGTYRGLHSQIAAVTTPLQAVRQLHRTGHGVWFDGEESFCINKLTGEVNHIRDDGINYLMGVWVIPKEEVEALGNQGFPWPAR